MSWAHTCEVATAGGDQAGKLQPLRHGHDGSIHKAQKVVNHPKEPLRRCRDDRYVQSRGNAVAVPCCVWPRLDSVLEYRGPRLQRDAFLVAPEVAAHEPWPHPERQWYVS